jgi:HlyD family secretion protein
MIMRQSINSWLQGIALVATAFAGIAISTSLRAEAQASTAEAALRTETANSLAINVVPVEKTAFDETILVTASLAPREEVLVSPQIEGLRIEEILVEEGDKVAAEQVLAKLSDGTVRAQLAQLQAGLSRADAAIAQARSQIAQAEATKKQAVIPPLNAPRSFCSRVWAVSGDL